MNDNYLIVNKKILPDYYEKVIEARNLIESGKFKNVSDAVKQVGISRSTYYKFKDYLFLPSEHNVQEVAVLNCILSHKRGVLNEVLSVLNLSQANILTINQSIPINNQAIVNISIDISNVQIGVDELIENIKALKGVSNAKLVAFD